MNEESLIIRMAGSGMSKMYSIPFSSLDYDSITRRKTIQSTPVKNLIQRGVPTVRDFPVPSCNGLVLLSDFDPKKDWAIWNPFTGEFLELPENDDINARFYSRCGFGYDKETSDYKIVMIADTLDTFIYSLKYGNWTRIKDFPNDNCFMKMNVNGALFDGALHWLCDMKSGSGEEIISLDLSDEKFRSIAIPSNLYEGRKYPLDKYLDALGGCLFLSCSYEESFDVWMLKDGEGGETAWVKIAALSKMYNVGIYLVNPRVVYYDKGKEQVVIVNKDYFMWIDVGKDSGSGTHGRCGLMWKTTVEGYGLGENYSCQVFTPSVVRLNGSNNASLKRKRTSSTGRLQLKLKTWDFRAPSCFEGQNPPDSEDEYLSDYENWSD